MEGADVSWRKSSYRSSNGGDCVEVTDCNGTIMVRDTKQQSRGHIHEFTPDQWSAFTDDIKADQPLR
jgi:hypothetical protein